MKDQYELSGNLEYPVFIIESDRNHKFTGFDIVYGSTGYSVWGRVPNSMQFGNGQVFDAGGRIYNYVGSSGYLRFSPNVCLVLDTLLIPGFISKVLEKLWYFGPRLMREELVSLDEYKKRILAAIADHGSKDIDQLVQILSENSDFPAVIEGVEWWRCYGGRRDVDGHPI